MILPQCICYSHWANEARNGMISIGQWGVFNLKKGAIWQSHLAPQKELLLPLSFLIQKPIKLDLSNLHYRPHYEPHYSTQGCVIRENNITTPITNPIKDTLVPLRTNFNANRFVRWRTYVYSNLLHWPMRKTSGNCNGVCRYLLALTTMCIGMSTNIIWSKIPLKLVSLAFHKKNCST